MATRKKRNATGNGVKTAARCDCPADNRLIECTRIDNSKGLAAKQFGLNADGTLSKKSAAQIFDGTATRIGVANLKEFLDVRAKLKSSQALAYGIARNARIVMQRELSGNPGAIARDAGHFEFQEKRPGMMMLDHDPRQDDARTAEELDANLCEAVPQVLSVERAWVPSSSAFIYTRDGRELIGRGGWRCYFVVDDASAIPDVGALLCQRLWERGHGYVLVSKSGAMLDRTVIDASVWQAERLDFAAEPELGDGLQRRAPKPLILTGAPMLVTAGLVPAMPMNEWRGSNKLLADARHKAKPEADKKQKAFVKERQAEMKNAGVATKYLKRVLAEAVSNRVLRADFVLTCDDGASVTVREVLADPKRFDAARFADPIESDYRGDNRIAFVRLGRDPYLYSHAHGGMRYALSQETDEITVANGERPRAVDEALDIMRHCGEFYQRGKEMVRVSAGEIIPLSDEYLADYLGRNVRFSKPGREGGNLISRRIDVPAAIPRQIQAKRGEWGFRELHGVLTAPTLRPDGSILCKPGYDERTGLLLQGDGFRVVPPAPTMLELRRVFKALWQPFAEFPFSAPADRAALLAAVLTALVRHMFRLAPAFSFDAPAAGTGKTLLATCIQVLCGMKPSAIPECRDEEEMRKRLVSSLREGKPAILLDNIRGDFRSGALEALITAETFEDRKLGSSEMLALPTVVMVLISGNNFRPSGDLFRRIVTCRIDAKTDAPERRSFALKPIEFCVERRHELVAAGLTLLQGFIAAGKPRDEIAGGRLGSFEQWDELIRQCVLWLGRECVPEAGFLGDPIACVEAAKRDDPERQRLAAFIAAVSAWQNGRQSPAWKVSDIVEYANAGHGSDFYDAVLDVADNGRRVIDARQLGIWLCQHRDMRAGNEYIERLPQPEKSKVSARWRIVSDMSGACRHAA